MNTPAVSTCEDRSMLVAPGQIVRTQYVDVRKCSMACRERMSIGDVKGAYEKLLQCGASAPWPCPRGYWEGDTFIIEDGRHEFVASLMLGKTHILVAWIESGA